MLTDIVLPNGTWQLGAIPRGGWPQGAPYSTTLRMLGALLAAACGFAAWRLVRDPVHLRREVAAARENILVSERRQSLLVDSVEDYAIYMLAPDGTVASWNNGARRIKGYTAEEVIGHSYSLFFPPDAAASGLPEAEIAAAREQGRYAVERWHRRKDGTRFLGTTTIAAIREGEAGRLLGFSVVTHDLSQRIEIESSLRESNRRFLDIVGIAGEFIWETDADGRYTFVSDRVHAVLGHSPAELLHCPMVDLMVPEDGARMTALLRSDAGNGESVPPRGVPLHRPGRTNGLAMGQRDADPACQRPVRRFPRRLPGHLEPEGNREPAAAHGGEAGTLQHRTGAVRRGGRP